VSRPAEAETIGVLLVDKPRGWTSHDVVGRVRRLVGQRRVGHTGTLDPLATGLLVVCLGRATRLAEYVGTQDKRYEGEIELGVRTTTDDAEGDVLGRSTPPLLEQLALRDLEARFTGRIQQKPPAFSAIRIGGRRAYAAARRGEPLDLPERSVTINRIALSPSGQRTLHVTVHCGHGTYIRSLARDIGEAIGCGAHLAGLRRTAVGRMLVSESLTPDELAALRTTGLLERAIQPPDLPLSDLPALLLSSSHVTRISHGSEVETGTSESADLARVYGPNGDFVAMAGLTRNGRVRPLKVVRPAPGV